MSLASTSAPTFIHLHAKDTVVVALKELPQGTKIVVAGAEIVMQQTIPLDIKLPSNPTQPTSLSGNSAGHWSVELGH